MRVTARALGSPAPQQDHPVREQVRESMKVLLQQPRSVGIQGKMTWFTDLSVSLLATRSYRQGLSLASASIAGPAATANL